jgi:transglutaminase-like putative cysteine protease
VIRNDHFLHSGSGKQMMQSDVYQISAQTEWRAINIGCTLGYHLRETAPILFLCTPQPDHARRILEDRFIASTNAPVSPAIDAHGNLVLRTTLLPGYNVFRHEATYLVPDGRIAAPQTTAASAKPLAVDSLPIELLRYLLPSRYCESDKLYAFAADQFGRIPYGRPRALAICDWVRRHIAYRCGSGDQEASACDILRRGYGVCRDLAHLAIALCRAADMPARYVAGHIIRLRDGQYDAESDIGADFHAYLEVYLDEAWHTFDARFGNAHPLRIKLAHGMDAVDAAFATFYGDVTPEAVQVWAHEIDLQQKAIPAADPPCNVMHLSNAKNRSLQQRAAGSGR